MSEKRRVYGRIDLATATSTTTKGGVSSPSGSTTTTSNSSRARVINSSNNIVESVKGAVRASPSSSLSLSSSASHPATPGGSIAISHGGIIKARVLGYGSSKNGGDSSSSSSPVSGVVSTPPPSSSYRTPPSSATTTLTPTSAINRAASPLGHSHLPHSVSTRAFDKRVRAASTEPSSSSSPPPLHSYNDSPTTASGNGSRYGSVQTPTSPLKRKTFPPSSLASSNTTSTSSGSSHSGEDHITARPGAAALDIRTRTKSRVILNNADPSKTAGLHASVSTPTPRPLPPSHTNSSPTLLPSASIAPPRARLKSSTSSMSVFTRSTATPPATQSIFTTSTSQRPPSPIRQRPPRQRPPSPIRRPASPLRATQSYSATPSSTSTTGNGPASPSSRRTFQTSSSSSAGNISVPPPSPIRRTTTNLASSMAIADSTASTTSPPPLSSDTSTCSSNPSSSSTSSYSTLSPEIFSPDSAKTVTRFSSSSRSTGGVSDISEEISVSTTATSVESMKEGRGYHRGRRRSGSSNSSNSSVQSDVSAVASDKLEKMGGKAFDAGLKSSSNAGIGITLPGGGTEGMGKTAILPIPQAATPMVVAVEKMPLVSSKVTSPKEIQGSDAVLRSPKRSSGSGQLVDPTPAEQTAHRDAKVNRKILDLEITNTSLLAINSSLERTKLAQSLELRDLRRKLRDHHPSHLPPLYSAPLPSSPSRNALLSPAIGEEYTWGEEEEEEEMDWEEILERDLGFAEVVRSLEGLQRRAQEALDRSATSPDKEVGGKKVLNQFMLDTTNMDTPRKMNRMVEDESTTADTTLSTDFEASEEMSGITNDEEDETDEEASRSFLHTPEMSLGVD